MSSISAAVPSVLGIFIFRKLPSEIKSLLVLLSASISCDVISLILINNHLNSWPVVNIFIIIQFVLFFYLFDVQHRSVLLLWLFFGCILFGIANFLFVQGPFTFNSFSSYTFGILIIAKTLTYLHRTMLEMPVERIENLPHFWLAFGVLTYYGGNFFLFLFNNFMTTTFKEGNLIIWSFHNSLNVLKNCFIFIALWKAKTDSMSIS